MTSEDETTDLDRSRRPTIAGAACTEIAATMASPAAVPASRQSMDELTETTARRSDVAAEVTAAGALR